MAERRGLVEMLSSTPRWVTGSANEEVCPDCGAPLEQGYVRAPNVQDHWRGVQAMVCSDECGYYSELD